MVGTRGIKLKVYENGTDDNEVSISFNLQQAIRGIGNDKELLMARVRILFISLNWLKRIKMDQCCWFFFSALGPMWELLSFKQPKTEPCHSTCAKEDL
jgi:hypothetical protein